MDHKQIQGQAVWHPPVMPKPSDQYGHALTQVQSDKVCTKVIVQLYFAHSRTSQGSIPELARAAYSSKSGSRAFGVLVKDDLDVGKREETGNVVRTCRYASLVTHFTNKTTNHIRMHKPINIQNITHYKKPPIASLLTRFSARPSRR